MRTRFCKSSSTAPSITRAPSLLAFGVITIALGLLASNPTQAQQPGGKLKVAIKTLEPFVIFDGERNAGFSIDLWEALGKRIGREFEYVRVNTVREQINMVRDGAADVAITGISITRDRENAIDFSLPYFDAGLQIMTQAGTGSISPLTLLSTFLSQNVLQIVLTVMVFIIVIAVLFWLVERKADPSFPKDPLRGFGEAVWWACVTVVTVGYGDRVPRGFWGRVVAIFWMFLGLFLISNFTATITSELTLRQLQSTINSIDDLGDKRVVALEGTTGDRYLSIRNIRHSKVATIDQAYDELLSGQIDAIVYDSPVLQNYALTKGAGRVRMAGGVFNREAYGVALPQGSPLREEINRALLSMREDGEYDVIFARWFGDGAK
jgi:ABC-type amino acid transport substrate-binding protein